MQIVRKASLTPVLWKNGGGITHEVVRVPAVGDPFQWRVSVAQVDASGPFSNFSGYRRLMVLLRGAGVRLLFEGESQAVLRQAGEMAEFDGGIATRCELLAGPCTDLNLMVAKDLEVRAATLFVSRFRPLPEDTASTRLVFVIGGNLRIDASNGATDQLDPWDFALIAPGEEAALHPPGEGAITPLVFCAALNDNRARFHS